MKNIFKTIIMQHTIILFIQLISATNFIFTMEAEPFISPIPKSSDYNNCVTIKNESSDPNIQLLYRRTKYDSYAKTYYPLNISGLIGHIHECRMKKRYDGASCLSLYNPASQEKNLTLTTYNNDLITIHAINDKIARVTVENRKKRPQTIESHFTYQ